MKQNDIYELIIEKMIDNTREELLKKDEEYLRLEEKRAELEEKLSGLFSEDMKEYISLVQETNMRFSDVSYMAAVKDTIALIFRLNLIKRK